MSKVMTIPLIGVKRARPETPRLAPAVGTLVIPLGQSEENKTKSEDAAVIVVSQGIDIKASREMIVRNWRQYTPQKIVAIMRKHYTNLRTASVQISHLKHELAALPDPPPEEYLKGVKLSNKEYSEIRSAYQAKRQKDGSSVQVIPNCDELVRTALQYLCTSDANLMWCGMVVCTGWRPIEILKVAEINLKPTNSHLHTGWWACQTAFAKRSQRLHKYDQCRDRPFLAPAWLIDRGLKLVRKRWPTAGLTNRQINQKYGTHHQEILQRGFPNLVSPTHVLFRRMFAAYSYIYFKDDMPNMSQDTWSSYVLGHAVLNDQVLSYLHLQLQGAGKLDLFVVGKGMQVLSDRPKAAAR